MIGGFDLQCHMLDPESIAQHSPQVVQHVL
jgi:hypothetical protein